MPQFASKPVNWAFRSIRWRLYGLAMASAEQPPRQTPRPRHWFRAELLGGEGDGLRVEMADLHDVITVARNGGAPFVMDSSVAVDTGDIRSLGRYELVGPIGPDTPVYVAISE
jgi:hypothetical protein